MSLESLLIAIAFIVPGFLTSKLISARTSTRKIETSVFEDTTESILRSVYIGLLVASLFLAAYGIFLRARYPSYSSYLELYGFLKFFGRYPIVSAGAILVWLIAAFALAVFFGAKVDPLHSLMLRLSESRGGLSVDSFSLLREQTVQRREETHGPSQLWLRVRMKSGIVYRGEFMSATFREPGLEREILLANAYYVSANGDHQIGNRGDPLDYVLLSLSNAESVEFLYSDA